MVTVFAQQGKVLKMENINNVMKCFKEIPAMEALNEICRRMDTISVSEPLTAFGHAKIDKQSGNTIRQIQLMWKEKRTNDSDNHEVIYEWIDKS